MQCESQTLAGFVPCSHTSIIDDMIGLRNLPLCIFTPHAPFCILISANPTDPDMSEADEMRVDPARAQALIAQLTSVKDRIGALANGRNVCQSRQNPCSFIHT